MIQTWRNPNCSQAAVDLAKQEELQQINEAVPEGTEDLWLCWPDGTQITYKEIWELPCHIRQLLQPAKLFRFRERTNAVSE